MNNVQYLFKEGLPPERVLALPVDALGITHINYAFVYMTEEGALTTDRSRAPESGDFFVGESELPLLRALAELKSKFPGLRVLLSLCGGDRRQSRCCRAVAADPARTRRVAAACGQMLDFLGLDGIDLDWEYPENPTEIEQYIYMLRCIRQSVGPERTVSTALPTGEILANFTPGQVAELNEIMDFWNLMTYDLGVGTDFSFVAPMTARDGDRVYGYSSLPEGIDQMIGIGVPADRINAGVPSYGKHWRDLTDISLSDLEGIFGRRYGKWPPHLHYRELVPLLREDGWVRRDIEAAGCPMFYRADGQKVTDIAVMDDLPAIESKCRLIRSKGCGGVMMWCLNGDTDDWQLCRAIANELI